MEFNDRVAVLLSCAIYYDKQDERLRDKNVPEGWEKKDVEEHAESGLYCILFVKVDFDAQKFASLNRSSQ